MVFDKGDRIFTAKEQNQIKTKNKKQNKKENPKGRQRNSQPKCERLEKENSKIE